MLLSVLRGNFTLHTRPMPLGRRCSLGCESWPDSDKYAVCVACGEETVRHRNLQPLDPDEAHSLKSDLEFEDYYQRRCEERNIATEGPFTPLEPLAA